MRLIGVSGLWAPENGNGLVSLLVKIKQVRPETNGFVTHWDYGLSPADIYIGHSYGCAAIMKYLRENPQVKPKLLVLLDGVPRWSFKQYQWKEWDIPTQVGRAVSFHRTAIFPPWSSPIKNLRPQDMNQGNFWWSHDGIPRDEKIHSQIVAMVKSL